jgi:hypothetical protein
MLALHARIRAPRKVELKDGLESAAARVASTMRANALLDGALCASST